MSNSLRDQLLGLGFKTAPKPAPRDKKERRGSPDSARPRGKPAGAGKPQRARPEKARGEIALADAYKMRAQREKDERIEAERIKQEEARQRREARARLEAFLKDKALNAADAEHVRHFEYGGKIKRIHVNAEQLKALNAGRLGVVQLNGRYLLVDAATLAQVETIFASAIALKVDPDAPVEEDPYSDPKYQVPDDLVW